MFRHMLRRNRVIEVTLLLAAVPLLSRGGLGVVQVDKEKCPPRLEGHDEHSSFDQYDRLSTIEPIGIILQSRFITVASGNVIMPGSRRCSAAGSESTRGCRRNHYSSSQWGVKSVEPARSEPIRSEPVRQIKAGNTTALGIARFIAYDQQCTKLPG
jgi:hypothetical protein